MRRVPIPAVSSAAAAVGDEDGVGGEKAKLEGATFFLLFLLTEERTEAGAAGCGIVSASSSVPETTFAEVVGGDNAAAVVSAFAGRGEAATAAGLIEKNCCRSLRR